MPYIRLTDKERESVKQERYERVDLELGPEPTIQDAAVLIPNVELARRRSDIHQRGATRTAILAERLQANGAWVLLIVGSLIEAERVFTGSRTLEQSIPASVGLAIFFVLANVVHPIYSLRQHRGQGYTEVLRQTLAGLFEHVWFWLTKPPMTERRDLNYNPALDRAAKLITRAVIFAALIALLAPVFKSHGQSWAGMATLLDNPFLLIKAVTGITFSVAGVLLLQAVAHEVGVRTLDDMSVTPEELLAKLREERRQAEQEIYDRILAEHLERKQASLAERRQRLPELLEMDTLADEIRARNGGNNGALVNE
jgi:hypothetical protein